MSRSKLHNDIMNLPPQSVVDSEFASRESAYMEGFTDARQDAAKLVLNCPHDYLLETDNSPETCPTRWRSWDWAIIVPAVILVWVVIAVLRDGDLHRQEVPAVEVAPIQEPVEVTEEDVISPALKSRRHKLNRRKKRDRRR